MVIKYKWYKRINDPVVVLMKQVYDSDVLVYV